MFKVKLQIPSVQYILYLHLVPCSETHLEYVVQLNLHIPFRAQIFPTNVLA